MAEHQLPKLDTGVRFPSPAHRCANMSYKSSQKYTTESYKIHD